MNYKATIKKQLFFVFILISFLNTQASANSLNLCLNLFNLNYENLAKKIIEVKLEEVPDHASQTRWKQLDIKSRFIDTKILEKSYINPTKKIILNSSGDEVTIGIVDVSNFQIALLVSNILSRSIHLARGSLGGHIPDEIVDRLWDTPTSINAVQNKWRKSGLRVLVSRKSKSNPSESEALGTILVSKNHENIFFLSGLHDNLKPEKDSQNKIIGYRDDQNKFIDQRYIEDNISSSFPDLLQLKPDGFYQIVNFAFHPEFRGLGLSKITLKYLIDLIASKAKDNNGIDLFESYDGIGFWQVAEPNWQKLMSPLNFYADPSQHVYMFKNKLLANSRSPLLTNHVTNSEYNKSWNVLAEYYLAMKILIDQSKKDQNRQLPDSLIKLFELALKNPMLIEAEKTILRNKEHFAQIEKLIRTNGVKFPERLPILIEFALNLNDLLIENVDPQKSDAKLQYKILSATFEDFKKALISK